MCANFIMVTVCCNLLLLTFCVGQAFGGRLPECSSDRLPVDETSNTMITCDQFGAQDTVTWFLTAQSSQDDVTLGSCLQQGSCNQGSKYRLTRSSTQSTVTITPSSDLRSIGTTYRIQCDASGTTSCALDVFYPAVVPAQNCRVEARSGFWTFDGSCNITKTFSSSDNYECRVFRGTSQSSQTTSVTSVSYTPRPHSNASYRTGSCSFSSDFMSLLTGITRHDFYFRIDVYPGPTSRVTGSVTLEKPESPTISCPDIVAENTTFTCTCSTTNLGQPAGHLVWSRVSGGTIIEGDYHVTTLTLPSQTLTRHDQGVNTFRCDVRWAAGTYMAVYTGNIGFPPSQTVLKVNSTTPGQTVTVSENDDVSFICTAAGGNPESTLTLSYARSTITIGSSPLIHSLGKAQCQHSGDYTCTVNNAYGDSVTSSTRLYVNCSPRGNSDVGKINFIRDPVSVVFVVTAYPVPVTGNFTFMGSSPSNACTRAVDSSFTGIQLSGGCVQKGSAVYQSVCIVTVSNLTEASAAGFYQVAVANARGSQSFKFQVISKGNAMITDQDSTQPSSYLGGIIGLAVVLAVMVIAAVAGVVWLWRRQWLLPCTDHKLLQNSEPKSSSATSELNPSPGLHPAVTEDIQGVDPRGPYDSLQMSDVGLKSVYSQIDQTQRRSDTKPVPDPTYQNTVQ